MGNIAHEDTDSSVDDPLYRLRHSLAHILAQAVMELRGNSVQLGFGPPIDTGCYYDFLLSEPLRDEELPIIQEKMKEIIKSGQEFVQEKLPSEEALKRLEQMGQSLKIEYCKELIEEGEKEIGFYTSGPFTDMCRGPHVQSTKEIPLDCFKVDSIAGAYWRGDEKRPQLTRVYCLAFPNKKELKDYIARRELARQRDHRKLGKMLDIYFITDDVGPGLPLWLPNGAIIRHELEKLAFEKEQLWGYQIVATPHIAKEGLYYKSGHLPYYKDSMYPPMKHPDDEEAYYLKAMNCPHHHMIYSHKLRSYRELPIRLAEYGTVYRYEASGTLSGLIRVRSMAMNDAHIYCSLDQIRDEIQANLDLSFEYYNMFRLPGVRITLACHDPNNKEKYIDDPKGWEFTERILKELLDKTGIEYDIEIGEAAFYGPKIDFQVKTILGKEETLTTSQLDFAAADRFNLTFTNKHGQDEKVYVVHRAPLSTHERFIGYLLEHFGGAFPTWLAPVQAMIIPVSESNFEYCKKIESELHSLLVRAQSDLSSKSFNKKIREAVTHKIPNILIIGEREQQNETVTVRRYCVKEQETMSAEAFIDRMKKLIANRVMDNFPDVSLPE